MLPFREREFEQLWLEVLAAYRKLAPGMTLTAAQTLSGGGPHYVFARPLKDYAEFESHLAPEHAVEKAFGRARREAFDRQAAASVRKWETLVLDRSGFDVNVP